MTQENYHAKCYVTQYNSAQGWPYQLLLQVIHFMADTIYLNMCNYIIVLLHHGRAYFTTIVACAQLFKGTVCVITIRYDLLQYYVIDTMSSYI